jgi:hypothetical protein
VLRVSIDALLMFWVSGLWDEVFPVLWTGMAIIVIVQLNLHLTAQLPIISATGAIALVVAAAFYSVRVAPDDLRVTVIRMLQSIARDEQPLTIGSSFQSLEGLTEGSPSRKRESRVLLSGVVGLIVAVAQYAAG